MSKLTFNALPTEVARAYQSGAPDAHGMPAETRVSESSDGLCRHCLQRVPVGKPYLVLAHRPFVGLHPYAEVGPIFLHAEPCERYPEAAQLPASLGYSPDYLIKGYDADDRIVYGTGKIVPTDDIPAAAARVLERKDVRYVDLRSARNNCFQLRIQRAI